MSDRNEKHTEVRTRSYDGPERREPCLVECKEAATIEAMKLRLDATETTANETLILLKSLNKKLLENNGTEAILPALNTRISKIEGQMLPHDDLHDVVRDYKLGRAILFYLTLCAVVGGAAILFWHLFNLTTPIPKGTP